MPRHGEIVVIKRNGKDGTHFPLTAKSCLFGRKTECDIRIQLPHVSKEHCKVEVKSNGEVFVTNLSTVNPTLLNGSIFKQPARLKNGDLITVIDRSFRFEEPLVEQGKRRSTGLDSDTFKVFSSTQSSDTNQTVRIESLLTSKTQRKSEGNIKTTHSRRSLQTSSTLEPRNNLSPFGELYEILKTKAVSQKENAKTPVKDKIGSPKSPSLKKSLQMQNSSQSPVAPKRNFTRSQSSDSPVTRPKEVVEPRSASAGGAREASKSPVRSPKAPTKNESIQGETEQTTRRNSSKRDSLLLPKEQVTPSVNGNTEKRSPRRSASAELSQVITQVQSTPNNPKTSQRRSPQSVLEQPASKNKDSSPVGKSPQGRRRKSLDKSPKATPNKSVAESKASEAEPTKPQRKRRSDELSQAGPPSKRKRVSFGGHLSPELFDKRLPPNSPIKKGATPARRSLSLKSPLTVTRKSFGLKQSVIREVFEQNEKSSTRTTPTRAAQPSPARSSSAKGFHAVTAKPSASNKSPAKSPSPARRSVSLKSPAVSRTSAAPTPVPNSPAKKSPVKTPIKISKLTPAKKSPSSKTTVKSPSINSKMSPVAKTLTPAKRSPVTELRSLMANTPTLDKRSLVTKTPTPAKKSPGAKMPSPVAVMPTPPKMSPVAELRSLMAKTPTPAKRSPGTKTPSSDKRSPMVGLRSPVARTPTPAKRSPVARTPTPAKRSPVARTPTPAKRSPVARTPTPAKRSPVARTPTPAKRSPVARTPTPAKRSPVARTPTPATPYSKGRFSVSRIETPPQEQIPTAQTPKSRKSLSVNKTPRSRKLEAYELLRSRRRSGASEANLLVSRTWADVVKRGAAKSQKKMNKPVQKVVATKKKLKHKTPMKKMKDLTSTGHADSPATILVGRAHTRTVNLTGFVPKVVRNQAVKLDAAHNESFTGVAELFSTPENTKQRKSHRLQSPKSESPSSVLVEMSGIKTPEEAGEMVVSPLNGSNTTRRKQYSRDAVSRLLQSPALSEVRKNDNATLDLAQETSISQKAKPESAGLSGIKHIMRTPKQRGTPVTDPHALRKLLRTPKESESPQAYSRRSTNLEVLGIDRVVKTPKQKGVPAEDFSSIRRIMKTPKEKSEPVVDFAGVKHIMTTPKEKGQPVEAMIGMKRLMRTPKEKSQPVEDMVGIKRIMRSPKVRGQPVEDMFGLQRLMRTPEEKGLPVDDIALNHLMTTDESVQSIESTRPIEEIFGIRNLIKTPPKSKSKEGLPPGSSSQSGKSPGSASVHRGRGRPAKRLSLLDYSASGNGSRYTVQSPIMQVSIAQSKQELVKSTKKRGRPSKSLNISSLEVPNEHVGTEIPSSAAEAPKESVSASDAKLTSSSQSGIAKAIAEEPKESPVLIADSTSGDEVVSPRRRGRPSSSAKSPKESLSNAQVTSPTKRGKPKATAEPMESVLIADSTVISPAHKGSTSTTTNAPKQSVSNAVSEVTSSSRRGRPSSTSKAPKDSPAVTYRVAASPSNLETSESKVPIADSSSDGEVISPRRRGRPSSAAQPSKESLSTSDTEVTSPSQRGRTKATAEEPKESISEATSPGRRGRPSSTAKSKESLSSSDSEVTSPSRRGRPKAMEEEPKESVNETTSPGRRGRPSSTAKSPKESLSSSDSEVNSPSQRGRPKAMVEESKESVNETTSAGRRGRPSSTAKSPKESLSSSDSEVTSSIRRGRPKATAEEPKESAPIAHGMVTSPARKGSARNTVEVSTKSLTDVSEATSPGRRGRPSATAKSPKQSLSSSDSEVTSPSRRGRPKSISQESKESFILIADSNSDGEVFSPKRRGRPSSAAKSPKESLSDSDAEVTSPTRRGRPKATGEKLNKSIPIADGTVIALTHKESISDLVSEVISPRPRGRPSSTAKSPKEPPAVSDGEAASPTRFNRLGNKVAVAEVSSVPIADISSAAEVVSPVRRGRPSSTAKSPKESLSGSRTEVTSPAKCGRPRTTAEAAKMSPVADVKVSPAHKQRPRSTTEVPKETIFAVSETSPRHRGRPSSTARSPKVSLSDSEVTSPTRRGRPKTTAAKLEESVPIADAKVTSPTRKGKLDTSAEAPKESVVSDVTPPRHRGRPRASVVANQSVPLTSEPEERRSASTEVLKETAQVSDVTSPSRRGRPPKITSPARKEKPNTPPEISKQSIADSDSKATSPTHSGVAKEPIPVVEGKTTSQTRRGKQKIQVELPQELSAPDVQVTRGSRSKGVADASKDSVPASNDVAISQKRRGRSKVGADVASEPTAPTRGSRFKDTTKESGLAQEEQTAQKSRGRPRKTVVPKKSVAVSEVPFSVEQVNPKSTNVTSPARKGRSRTTEVPKEGAAASGVTSPKQRQKLETTKTELDLPQTSSEDAIEKTTKLNKKAVRQNVKKSKLGGEEQLQIPEAEESIAPVAEKNTQLPPRGRRKTTQNESVPSAVNSSLEDEHSEKLVAQTSPVARRGGRRRNTEETSSIQPDVVKPKIFKRGTRGQSKSKGVTEDVKENADSSAPEEPVKSPEPKSPKKTNKQNLVTDLPVESPKRIRGRSKKNDKSPDTSYLASSEVSSKAVPARGRARTARGISNVPVSDPDDQTKGSSALVAKQQRGSRKIQSLPVEQTKPVASLDTVSPTKRTLGNKPSDTSESQSVPEVKGGRNTRGKTVQWHPLLATNIQRTTEVSAQDSVEVSTRGGRPKGKARPDASELQVPAKRSRRGNIQAESEETPASTNTESLTVSDVPAKRGRKAKVEDTDVKSTSNSIQVVHTSPQRGRRGESSRVVINENSEPTAARRQRGAVVKTLPENQSPQSPVKPKSQKGGSDNNKADKLSTKSTRGVKRKLLIAEAKSEPEPPLHASESVLVETENIPAGRGRKNPRNAKIQKGDAQKAVPEKQTVTSESPAKRRKTEAAPTAAQKKKLRQQTSKLENEKPSAVTRIRASTRSKK